MSETILIADDHPLFREALIHMIQSVLPECEVTEATDYGETHKLLREQNFALVFLDLNMPDSSGLTDLALLKKQHPQTPIIVVSADEDPATIQQCISYNASGYIIKSSPPEDIKGAINSVLQGDIHIPNLPDYSAQENSAAAQQISTLTPSQLNVLLEIAKGKLNKEIAYELEITEATVKAHITSVFKKLGLNNRTQAVLFVKEYQTKHASIYGFN